MRTASVTFLMVLSVYLQYNYNIVKNIQKDLERSKENLNTAYKREKLYKDLFTHDIRNILQIFQHSTDLISLKTTSQDVEIDDLVNMIKQQILRGDHLVKNIHILDKLEKKTIPKEIINLNKVIKAAGESIAKFFPEKEIAIKIQNHNNLSYNVPAIDHLQDLFEIVLHNAIIYNDSSKIEIGISFSVKKQHDKQVVKIEIVDNGIGIPDDLKKDLFYRYITHDKNIKGIGLGLVLARHIVEYCNGDINVKNKIKDDYTKGTKFVVSLPIEEIRQGKKLRETELTKSIKS
jgi:K+-sensing histidine kinase KdpD